jgi:single-strand DNA-binding protein
VANFSVATSESYKDKTTGEKKETTYWHNVVIWGSLAEVATKYLHKGDQVYLEGKITNRSYEKDGVTKYVTEIVASNMVMLGGKNQGGAPAGNQGQAAWDSTETQPSSAKSAVVDDGTDDLPF